MTERRKLRCGEPLRICSRLKIAMQKVEREDAYLKEYWELFRGRLYITSSDKVVFKKSMSVCCKYFFRYPLKRTKRRKTDFDLKNCCEISRDNNHQSLYKSI